MPGPALVDSIPEFKRVLSRGASWIRITEALSFRSPEDCIVLDELPLNAGGRFVLEAGGNWASGQINRLAAFKQPLISAGHSRDWEFRMRGLLFDGWQLDGPALVLEYAQISQFEDILIQRFGGGEPPFSVGVGGFTSATEFRDCNINWNEAPSLVANVTDVRWRGGAVQTLWGNDKARCGLRFTGAVHAPFPDPRNSIGGPLKVEDVHQEGSNIWIDGVQKVSVTGGFRVAGNVYITNSTIGTLQDDGYDHNSSIYLEGRTLNDIRGAVAGSMTYASP
jgi:hypothetical protein